MNKVVFVIKINNYLQEMCAITLPTIKDYARRIGAEYIEVTERKFPKFSIPYEKMQIYELGKRNDWNILIDADYMIHPQAPDFTTGLTDDYVGIMEAYDMKINLVGKDEVFEKDARYIGIAANFIITHKKTHNLWKPLEMSIKEVCKYARFDKVEEYCMSRNLAKYNYKFTGLHYHQAIGRMFRHLDVTTSKVAKGEIVPMAKRIREEFKQF